MTRNKALLLLCLCAALVCVPKSRAQAVEGISEIAYDSTNGEIDTYSATSLDYYASLYYDAYVQGALYQSDDWNNPIRSGYALDNPTADGYMVAPAVVGDDYELQSDHFVVAYYIVGYDAYGDPVYADEYGYSYLSSTDPVGDSGSYDPPMTYEDVIADYIYLGSTVVGISTYDLTPVITNISPNVIPDGIATTVEIDGINFGDAPDLQLDDAPNTTVSILSANDVQIMAQITPNGDEGPHTVEVISNGYGGTGFLSSPGTANKSHPQTIRVAGDPCTVQIATPQRLYHIQPSAPDGNGNYQTTTIALTLKTTNGAVCNTPSQVTWQVHAAYASSGGKGRSVDDPPGFASSLNQQVNYTTPAGVGGQITFSASFTTAGNKGHSMSKTVYIDGTAVPLASVKNAMIQDYGFPGGTPNLFLGIACTESRFKQFSTTRLKGGTTAVPLVLWGIAGCWPNESYDGGSHVGLTQVENNMTDAYDWIQNTWDGVRGVFLNWAIPTAQHYESSTRSAHSQLPALSTTQTEDNALVFYRMGGDPEGGPYWIPNANGTGWVANTQNPTGTEYRNSVRNNLNDPTCN